jgi:hypothetical protein
MDRRFLVEGIDCSACEFAPLKGQLLRASIVSWEEGKPPVIEYARGLTIRSSEIRLYLRLANKTMSPERKPGFSENYSPTSRR